MLKLLTPDLLRIVGVLVYLVFKGEVHLELFLLYSLGGTWHKSHVPPRLHELYCENRGFSIWYCIFRLTTSC